jgi:hypothetical protein
LEKLLLGSGLEENLQAVGIPEQEFLALVP